MYFLQKKHKMKVVEWPTTKTQIRGRWSKVSLKLMSNSKSQSSLFGNVSIFNWHFRIWIRFPILCGQVQLEVANRLSRLFDQPLVQIFLTLPQLSQLQPFQLGALHIMIIVLWSANIMEFTLRAEARTFVICRQVKLVFLVMTVTGLVIIGMLTTMLFDTSTMWFVDTFSWCSLWLCWQLWC